MNYKILLLAVLLLAACSPLRRTQRNQKVDSTATERSEIRKAVTDILRESGTFSQTVVEFYPPVVSGSVKDCVTDGLPAAHILQPNIARMIRTEVTANREQTTLTDSMARNDIAVEIKTESSEKTVDKPPAATGILRWTTIGLVTLLLMIIALKFRWIKL